MDFQKKIQENMHAGSQDLNHLPELYKKTNDLSRVIQEMWGHIVKNTYIIVRNINRVDTISDFCVYSFENLPKCFAAYNKNTHVPFSAFLFAYQKHLFQNFLRSEMRKEIKPRLYFEIFSHYKNHSVPSALPLSSKSEENGSPHFHGLPLRLRIIAKLYVGMELNIIELRLLVQMVKCPQRVADFLMERKRRLEKTIGIRERYEARKAHLQCLMHLADTEKKAHAFKCQKRKTHAVLKSKINIHEASHLARLFKVSKSTMYRRLRTAAFHLDKEAV